MGLLVLDKTELELTSSESILFRFVSVESTRFESLLLPKP